MRGLLLVDDPFELNNLLEGSLTPQAQAAYDGTRAAREVLRVSL